MRDREGREEQRQRCCRQAASRRGHGRGAPAGKRGRAAGGAAGTLSRAAGAEKPPGRGRATGRGAGARRGRRRTGPRERSAGPPAREAGQGKEGKGKKKGWSCSPDGSEASPATRRSRRDWRIQNPRL